MHTESMIPLYGRSCIMKTKLFCALGLSYLLFAIVPNESVPRDSECPEAEDIVPCRCDDNDENPIMHCENINNVRVLRKVFENADNHYFHEVFIMNSSLKYLPHQIFSWTGIGRLNITLTKMATLFYKTPVGADSVEHLELEFDEFQEQFKWDDLQLFTKLKTLIIKEIRIKILGRAFAEHVTKSLENLIFSGTETRKIYKGTLVHFTNLKGVQIVNCSLTKLRRSIFPSPAKIKTLNFRDNRIEEIPKNLFTNMPELAYVNFENNLIKKLREFQVDVPMSITTELKLNGNPLDCKCLQWLYEYSFEVYGKCETPREQEGKDLHELRKSDLKCRRNS